MSIKSDFNSYISKYYKGKINELCLIEALMYSFDKNGAYTSKYHGPKGFVEFDISVLSPLLSYKKVRCEIADILFIFVSNSQIRYTFLQNKYSRIGDSDSIIPRANTRQYFLLSQRPVINPLKTGLPPNILKDSLCPGCGSYGDFYFDGVNYDMRYFVAKTLFPKNKQTADFYSKAKNRCLFNTYLDKNWLNFYNNQFECSHASSLDEFEIMAKRMLIGSPININSSNLKKCFYKLIVSIVNKSNKINKNEKFVSYINGLLDDDMDDCCEYAFAKNYVIFDCTDKESVVDLTYLFQNNL